MKALFKRRRWRIAGIAGVLCAALGGGVAYGVPAGGAPQANSPGLPDLQSATITNPGSFLDAPTVRYCFDDGPLDPNSVNPNDFEVAGYSPDDTETPSTAVVPNGAPS